MRRLTKLIGALCLLLAPSLWAQSKEPASPPPPPSSQARKLYDAQKDKLVQIRVLVAGTESQASAGSGFLVASEGLIITNYHVISQLILEPERYRAELVRTDQAKAPVQIMAIDVVHDLALLRTGPKQANGDAWPVFTLAPDDTLKQGDKVFSLGNPLDLGFAISEGTFNGHPERALYPQLLFTGAMNPGVSGGPAIDAGGRVVGVNVAGYGRSAELTNFQVPVQFARALIERGSKINSAINAQLKTELRSQLVSHQRYLLGQLHTGQWRTQPLGGYQIPVMPERLARCWGRASEQDKKNYRFETAQCSVDSGLYVDHNLRLGGAHSQHEASGSNTLGALRFARLRSKSFHNESPMIRPQDKHRTASRCSEDFTEAKGMTLRTVVCVRAYKKFEGLYDLSLLTQSLDAQQEGLESKLNLSGVELEPGLAEIRRFMDAIVRQPKAGGVK
jgi:serine protease Do